jgi:copper homeostasis protein
MLEIIAETVADARAAEAGGATQLDLKSDFVEFGLTPTAGMVEQVCSSVNIEVLVMVRTHANGMVLSPVDLEIMCADIRLAAARGASGFLLGALTETGTIDKQAVTTLQQAAGTIPLHFHLAWELTTEPEEALEELIDLGVKSVRTTGGQGLGGHAVDGLAQLKRFQQQAQGRIDLLLAGGVSAVNVGQLVSETGIVHAHAGSSVRTPPNPKGSVDQDKVHQLRSALDEVLATLA